MARVYSRSVSGRHTLSPNRVKSSSIFYNEIGKRQIHVRFTPVKWKSLLHFYSSICVDFEAFAEVAAPSVTHAAHEQQKGNESNNSLSEISDFVVSHLYK